MEALVSLTAQAESPDSSLLSGNCPRRPISLRRRSSSTMLRKVLRRAPPEAIFPFFYQLSSRSPPKLCPLDSSQIGTSSSYSWSHFTTDAAAVSSPVIQSTSRPPDPEFNAQVEPSTPIMASIDGDASDDGFEEVGDTKDENLERDIKSVLWCMQDQGSGLLGAERRLGRCGVRPAPALVEAVLSQFREAGSRFRPSPWSSALAFFRWAGCQPGYSHFSGQYESMITILARNRQFDAAWTLIDEMSGRTPVRTGRCLVRSRTLLILARWYSAAGEPAKAITTFLAMKDFGLKPGVTEFQSLLSSLCRYGYPADAEHMLLRCGRQYVFRTRTFNIVLAGWCDAPVPSVADAKRFWKVMESHWVPPNAASYAAMISCMSRAGEADAVIALFSEMKAGKSPDGKVYNDVIRMLSRVNRIKEAVSIFKSAEAETGIPPDAEMYAALFGFDGPEKAARGPFDRMFYRTQKPSRSPSGLSPSCSSLPVYTGMFHDFFRRLTTGDDVMEVLNLMRQSCCRPRRVGTYVLVMRKLCELGEHKKVLDMWTEICNHGPLPDHLAYTRFVHGLFWNGWREDARRFYLEMKTKGSFITDPRVELGFLVKRPLRLVGAPRAPPRYVAYKQR